MGLSWGYSELDRGLSDVRDAGVGSEGPQKPFANLSVLVILSYSWSVLPSLLDELGTLGMGLG